MYAWVRYPVKWLYKIFYDFHIEGIENIPQDRPVVLASNHRSYADPVILTMPIKRPVSYMAKEELFHNKLFGWFIRKLGAFPVTRGAGDMSVIDDSINILRSGRNLVIFPEGTRSHDFKPHEAKGGVCYVAKKCKCDVVPVSIYTSDEAKKGTKLTVRYGKPIKYEELNFHDDIDKLKDLRYGSALIMERIKELWGLGHAD